jgi:hypothetical protein
LPSRLLRAVGGHALARVGKRKRKSPVTSLIKTSLGVVVLAYVSLMTDVRIGIHGVGMLWLTEHMIVSCERK